ncbi:helix-turn-helix domain-containing protein [Beijerinckia indica]|uniref:Transcriptional regulator, XRE family n=1 Tax=Beijerinckia indica subsp. indica (strain ATCC 9039 / DSM 1715 / NCIMB 8712) TaxID=395963 RepID=B2ICE5_BEII9|nr:helix-turn-helix transcriptional regulator [Beijerinckia indica]ACB96742.1 transcriptional regulator, XRE family [Beijerinckia indica subsp. indica ATCC 9039]
MTPAQCRAARGLLNLNQDKLAELASVSSVTVRNFENEKSSPQRATLEVMRRALEAAGVEFIAENGGGAGVRLRKQNIENKTPSMRQIIDIVELPEIRIISTWPSSQNTCEKLVEGLWIPGRYDKNIRIDQPTHLKGGQPHAHVLGRKGQELVIVNADGTASHGTKGRLHAKDADALRQRNFQIPEDNIIEFWSFKENGRTVLCEDIKFVDTHDQSKS